MKRRRSEPAMVNRRIHELNKLLAHQAHLITDQSAWARISPQAQQYVIAQHNALVWVLGVVERHKGAIMAEAQALENAYRTMEKQNAPPV